MGESVAKAIFYHREDSRYDDDPARFYHFPKQYLGRVERTLGDFVIYYGPLKGKPGRYYSGVARVDDIQEDRSLADHYYAFVSHFLNFDVDVPFAENGGYEKALFKPDGTVNGGRAVQAVRIIEPSEFAAIVARGLSKEPEWPDRRDDDEAVPALHFAELEQAAYAHDPRAEVDRRIVQHLLNRPYREAKFKQHVREVYDRRCAFTGLRLINGRGRPEVEAAHIKPVEAGGPDSIRNGIALSGTVHWMFDRGLLSLADDFTILTSRHLNHDVSKLLVPDMRALVPDAPHLRPHPHYLEWHRSECFKA
jgi:Predicted restriction endonuclease